jgi:hypothetical protein
MHTQHLLPSVATQPNLELKTRPKKLLGFLPLDPAWVLCKLACPNRTNLTNYVQRAHEQLVEVPVLHEGRVAPDGVFEHGPDLPFHVLLDLGRVTEKVQAKVGLASIS